MTYTRIQELTEIAETSKDWAEYIARLKELQQTEKPLRIQFASAGATRKVWRIQQ